MLTKSLILLVIVTELPEKLNDIISNEYLFFLAGYQSDECFEILPVRLCNHIGNQILHVVSTSLLDQ